MRLPFYIKYPLGIRDASAPPRPRLLAPATPSQSDNPHDTMDEPSAEWLAFDAANPHLNINSTDSPPFPSPTTFRDAVNTAKESSVRALLAKTDLPHRVSVTDSLIPTRDGATIPVRIYRFKHEHSHNSQFLPAAFLYFHGGGMLLGTPATEDLLCSRWSSLLGPDFAIISVCYRHTPEYTYPTQQNDAWDALQWVFETAGELGVDTGRVVVGGVSSGGGLAAGVVRRSLGGEEEGEGEGEEREGEGGGGKGDVKGEGEVERGIRGKGGRGRIKGQVLAMPWLVHRDVYPPFEEWARRGNGLGGRAERSSMVLCQDAPIMPRERYDLFTDLLGAETAEQKAEFSVGLVDSEERLRGVPPSAVVVCGRDILRDEGMAFAEMLERVGSVTYLQVLVGSERGADWIGSRTPIKKHVFPGLPHSFTRYHDLPSSRRFDELMVESIRWCVDDNRKSDVPGKWALEGDGLKTDINGRW